MILGGIKMSSWNQFMISLPDVSIKETTKRITDWKYVAHKLDVLHNLPKVYLSSKKEGGCCNRLSINWFL